MNGRKEGRKERKERREGQEGKDRRRGKRQDGRLEKKDGRTHR
jgi:hypothetical protein